MDREINHSNNFIDGCKQGDRKTQHELYMYFYDAMMNLCVRYTKNETDAEDVYNSAMLNVFRGINQYDSKKAALYTWVRMIVINCCIRYLQSKQKIITSAELNVAEEVFMEPEVNVKMNEQEILELIRGLAPATRAVFNLYTIDGYSHKEIASMLQISEGTSKWHLNAARTNLRAQLIEKRKSL